MRHFPNWLLVWVIFMFRFGKSCSEWLLLIREAHPALRNLLYWDSINSLQCDLIEKAIKWNKERNREGGVKWIRCSKEVDILASPQQVTLATAWWLNAGYEPGTLLDRFSTHTPLIRGTTHFQRFQFAWYVHFNDLPLCHKDPQNNILYYIHLPIGYLLIFYSFTCNH